MESNKHVINEISILTNRILNYDIDKDLIRTAELGKMNFSRIRDELFFIFEVLRKLNTNRNLEIVPSQWLGGLNARLGQFEGQLKILKDSGFRTERDHDGILNQFMTMYESTLDLTLKVLQVAKMHSNELTEAEKSVKELHDMEREMRDQSQKFSLLVEKSTETVNANLQRFGMRKYAKIFEDESNAFGKSSKWWLRYTVCLLFITVVAGFLLLFYSKNLSSNFDAVQFTITKVLIISALFYGISMCVKTYRAQKHNEILNKHRQNALMTFEAFQTEDVQTKNAILLEATHTIFGNQSTGYNAVDSVDHDLPSKIIEVIKTPTK